MKIYKFGGASVRNADGVQNLLKIIGDEQDLFIIVSAMGKTTNALEKVFEDHKAEATRQSETRIKAEVANAKLSLNQALAKSQLEIKRRQSKVQQELKDKIFEEADALIDEFMKTEAYNNFLIKCIRKAVAFAGNDELTIYINPTDEKRRSDLEDATRVHLTISAEDFRGGVRAVIRSRNILIDNSFSTQLKEQYDKFVFLGGDGIA